MKTLNQFILLISLASALAAQPSNPSTVSLEVVDPSAAETLIFQNNIDWAEFRVRRTGDLSRELVVYLDTQQGSARLGEDYRLDGVLNGSAVRIPAGTNSVNVRLYPIDDDFYEGDEDAFCHLIAPPPGTPLADQYGIDIEHSQVAMIIHDNDAAATRLYIAAPRNDQPFEPGDVIELRAEIVGPGGTNSWSVEFFDGVERLGTTRPGTAIWWGAASGGKHVIAARATDSQGTELIAVPVPIQVGPGAALPVVRIVADPWRTSEPCPTCLVASGVLTIERTAPTNSALTVFLATDGTATANEDYVTLAASVEIPAGQYSTQLKLLPRDDQLAEGPEIVRVRVLRQPPPLLPPTYFVNVHSEEALLVILDDEANAPQARLDIVAPANGSHLRFPSTVELSALAVYTQNEVYGPVDFYDGDQFIARSTVTAATRPAIPGLPSVHTAYWTNPPVGPHILTARTRLSLDQSIAAPPVNVTVDAPTLPVVRLETLPPQNAQALEFCPPNADCAYPSFAVRRIGPTNADLRVYLSYSGTATAGVDYPQLPDSLVIPAGRDAAVLMLVPKDDALIEGPETVIAAFTPVPGPGYIQDPDHSSAAITILDNERPLDTVVSIGTEDEVASEISMLTVVDPARFRISRIGDLSRDLQVFFSLHGSATPGVDYEALNSSVRIPAGQSSVTFDVTPKFDQLAEGMETVVVRLEPSPLAGPLPDYEIARTSRDAVAIILDNGSSPTPGLEIIWPEDGARISPTASIEIVAAAYHPTRDIQRVDFYDGEVKIGESIIVFDRTDSGGLIVHRFTWNQPPNGVHVLTARGFDSNQTPILTSKPVRIVVGTELPLPVVKIEATQRIAEESSEPLRRVNLVGEFTVSRTGPTNPPLSVFVKYAGIATPGVDYPFLPGLVTIPAGAVSTTIRVVPTNDRVSEGIETLVATLSPCGPNIDPATGILCVDGFDIDPAKASATVFIRDDGITEASLVIIRPQNGSVFNAGDAIPIEAVAIDLNGYISQVEFWDGEQKIGASEIVFIRAPDPGSPIQHSFEWRGAASGPHLLTARAIRADGTVLQSPPVSIVVGNVSSIDRELHAISIYSGVTANGGPSQHNEPGDAAVAVNRPGKRVTLFLSSYEPVRWHVTAGNATVIEKVILGGYYRQEIDGISPEVQILNAFYDEGRGSSDYLWPGTSLDSGRFFRVLQKVCGLVGMDWASFQGKSVAPYPTPFEINQVQNDPRLRCDYPQPVDLSQLPNLSFRLAFHNGEPSGSLFFQDFNLQGVRNAPRLLPTWRVVTDADGRYYYGADFHQLWKVDSQTGVVQALQMPSTLPEFSWPVGITFDSNRNRILVATLVGEGYLYAYAPASGQWSLVRSLANEDLDALVYHAPNDSLYGVRAAYYDGGAPSLLRLNASGEVTGEIPLPVQPYGVGSGGFTSELASVGEYLVLLLETGEWVVDNGRPEARIYLIDPRTGQIWLTYRSVGRLPNKPPFVTMVAPADGTTFNPGANIALGANVTDPDGDAGRAKVEFFANGRKLGDAFGPVPGLSGGWVLTWTNVPGGDYAITARATDALGGTATSAPVHIIVGSGTPLVRIEATSSIAEESSAPFRRMNLVGEFTVSRTGPTNQSLTAYVHYSGTAVQGVDYPQLPWIVTIPAGAASTAIRVQAIPDQLPEGIETLVATVSQCPPPEILPPCFLFQIDPAHATATVFIRDDGLTDASLVITKPPHGASLPGDTTILIEATAIDLNGHISWVEFWDGERKIGDSVIDFFREPDPGTPIDHRFEWRGAALGSHVLTARAVRADGTVLKSFPVQITVGPVINQSPRVAITRPAAGTEFPANTEIEIVAECVDPDGFVGRVEFFADGLKIGERNIVFIRPPEPGQKQVMDFVWRLPTPGAHVLTASATDDSGGTTTSSPVEIRVTMPDTLPMVDVVVRDAFAVEPRTNADLDSALFRIRRFGPTNADLTVTYSLQGAAENGVDYEKLSGQAVIPAGQRFVNVTVRPLADNLIEPDETVILRLEDSPQYTVGLQRRALALISDYPAAEPVMASACQTLSNGMLKVCFVAQTGANFRVEASSDLRTWETVYSAASVSGALQFVDAETARFPRRFYRLAPEPVADANP